MKVTDLDYHLETKLVKKLDIMIKRCTDKKARRDAVLICEGSEGEGKTNTSEAIAYYTKYTANMPIHMFFRLGPLIEHAQNTENQIIIWDEPALDSLSTDWFKETNKDLIRLLMTCRKKRHFFIFNFVKFYKFSEYVVVDRALGLIHMYTRHGQQSGRFVYIKLKNLENLYRDYKVKKKRSYKIFKSFGGWVPLVENKLEKMGITIEGHPNCSLADYEKLKDEAIKSIGKKKAKEDPIHQEFKHLKYKIGNVTPPIMNKPTLAEQIGVSARTLLRWSKLETIIPPKGG